MVVQIRFVGGTGKTLENQSKGKDRKEGKIRTAVVVCCGYGVGGGCERGALHVSFSDHVTCSTVQP